LRRNVRLNVFLERTRVSKKGQVPKGLRERHGSAAEVELEASEESNSEVLRRTGHFPPAKVEDVCGCLKHEGPPISVAGMDEAVQREARKHR
jgi:bifunctional DNA-binding transcriptional regulator/antitoxin component of YhaV-PrlF toxin-antitoxin module